MAEWVDQHGLTRARHSRVAACYEWRSQKWSMITDYDLNSYLFLLFETFINHAYYKTKLSIYGNTVCRKSGINDGVI